MFVGIGKSCIFASLFERRVLLKEVSKKFGEVVEWSITAVLKTAERRRSGGSNPSLSAIKC